MTPAEMAKLRWKGTTATQRRRAMSEAGKLGGRPRKDVTCGKCGATGGTAEMRKHRCSAEKPKRVRKAFRIPPAQST